MRKYACLFFVLSVICLPLGLVAQQANATTGIPDFEGEWKGDWKGERNKSSCSLKLQKSESKNHQYCGTMSFKIKVAGISTFYYHSDAYTAEQITFIYADYNPKTAMLVLTEAFEMNPGKRDPDYSLSQYNLSYENQMLQGNQTRNPHDVCQLKLDGKLSKKEMETINEYAPYFKVTDITQSGPLLPQSSISVKIFFEIGGTYNKKPVPLQYTTNSSPENLIKDQDGRSLNSAWNTITLQPFFYSAAYKHVQGSFNLTLTSTGPLIADSLPLQLFVSIGNDVAFDHMQYLKTKPKKLPQAMQSETEKILPMFFTDASYNPEKGYTELQKLADAGDKDAITWMAILADEGLIYMNSVNDKINYAKAVTEYGALFKDRAELTEENNALEMIGFMNKCLRMDNPKAPQLLPSLAPKPFMRNYTPAVYFSMCQNSSGGSQQYQRYAEQNRMLTSIIHANHTLGWQQRHDLKPEIERNLKAALDKDDPFALVTMADVYVDHNETDLVIPLIDRLIRHKSPMNMYEAACGVIRNMIDNSSPKPEELAYCDSVIKIAADKDVDMAMYLVGLSSLRLDNIEMQKKGIDLLQKAGIKGNRFAAMTLANIYADKNSGLQDYSKAVFWVNMDRYHHGFSSADLGEDFRSMKMTDPLRNMLNNITLNYTETYYDEGYRKVHVRTDFDPVSSIFSTFGNAWLHDMEEESLSRQQHQQIINTMETAKYDNVTAFNGVIMTSMPTDIRIKKGQHTHVTLMGETAPERGSGKISPYGGQPSNPACLVMTLPYTAVIFKINGQWTNHVPFNADSDMVISEIAVNDDEPTNNVGYFAYLIKVFE